MIRVKILNMPGKTKPRSKAITPIESNQEKGKIQVRGNNTIQERKY